MPRSPPFLRPPKCVLLMFYLCECSDFACLYAMVMTRNHGLRCSFCPNVTPCFITHSELPTDFPSALDTFQHQTLLCLCFSYERTIRPELFFFQLKCLISLLAPNRHRGHHSCDRCWQDASYDASVVLLPNKMAIALSRH